MVTKLVIFDFFLYRNESDDALDFYLFIQIIYFAVLQFSMDPKKKLRGLTSFWWCMHQFPPDH